jgi:preprotein translocase subunit SecG
LARFAAAPPGAVDPPTVLPYVRAMFTFLLVVQAVIAAALVTVILMQRSEGGGLTSSGSPSGLMSARGAADFLTRATSVLASLFVAMSIVLAFIAANRNATSVDTSLQRRAPAAQRSSAPPASGDGLSDAARAAAAAQQQQAPADNGVPLAR